MAKDFYNEALYAVRQHFFQHNRYMGLGAMFQEVKTSENYRSLHSDTGQLILRRIDEAFQSFFALLRLKKQGEYDQPVHLPNYLDKEGFTTLSFIPRQIKAVNGKLRLSLGRRGQMAFGRRFVFVPKPPNGIKLRQVRLVPKFQADFFQIEWVYDQEVPRPPSASTEQRVLGIDLGLDNLAAGVATTGSAFILEGKGIKSYNRWFNKRKAKLQSIYDTAGVTSGSKMRRLLRDRYHVMHNFMHHCSRYIVDFCKREGITDLIVGDWGDMKREQKLAKKVSQLFQQLPYGALKQQLEYKCKLAGIRYHHPEESYTSQTCHHCGMVRKANRKHRGLYVCKRCKLAFNADTNAAVNIARKVVPESFQFQSLTEHERIGDSGVVITPSRKRLVAFG